MVHDQFQDAMHMYWSHIRSITKTIYSKILKTYCNKCNIRVKEDDSYIKCKNRNKFVSLELQSFFK